VGIGILAAVGVSRLLATYLYRVQTHDPLIIVVVLLALTLVSLSAGLLPARRAASIDPCRRFAE
jgi:putative ABC transport system permease protein